MFGKKRCPNCGEKVKDDWSFCPYCGEELEIGEALAPFGEEVLEDIEKELERMDKMFGSPFKFFKSKPLKGGGISITIRSGTGMEPKVEIKTSGEYKKIEPELKKRLGVRPAIEEVEEEEEKPKVERKAKVTEEAETEVKTLGNKQIISVKLPDVESEDDIEIKRLEQSMEIKAFAGDKAYFTLVPLPANAAIVKKEFKNGVLRIEVEK
jgi:HSP20 family molecular chaperone IbpA